MKRNWYICSLLYLFIFLFILGCGPRSPSPYFWKVEKENKVSYLLGTYHNGVSLHELPCSKNIVNKIKSSDLVFVEVADDFDEEAYEVLLEEIMLPNGEAFEALSKSSRRFLKEKKVSNALSFFGYWIALSNLCLEEAIGKEKMGISMDEQVESIANSKVRSLDNKKLRDLPKDIFDSKDIDMMITRYPMCPAEEKLFIEDYKNGDVDYAYSEEDQEILDKTDRFFLKERNEHWFKNFKKAHSDYEQIFLAAGLGHFLGSFNLIDMFEDSGFDVERVSCPQ